MSIATILTDLYEGFGPEAEGEDYALGIKEYEREISAEQAVYWGEVNAARAVFDCVEWDGLLNEAIFKVKGEADPNLLTDRLLEAAALAVAYAESVQRQTLAFNGEEE